MIYIRTKFRMTIFMFAPCINYKHFIIQLMHNMQFVDTIKITKYSVIQKYGLNFARLYFLNYIRYVNDLHNIWKRRSQIFKYHL